MQRKLIVYVLVLALSMAPFSVNTASAGGGGGCSGEDEDQCLAVVFGTAAVIILVTYFLLRNDDVKKTETPEGQPSEKESRSAESNFHPSEEKEVSAFTRNIEDYIALNGDIIIWQW